MCLFRARASINDGEIPRSEESWRKIMRENQLKRIEEQINVTKRARHNLESIPSEKRGLNGEFRLLYFEDLLSHLRIQKYGLKHKSPKYIRKKRKKFYKAELLKVKKLLNLLETEKAKEHQHVVYRRWLEERKAELEKQRDDLQWMIRELSFKFNC